MSEISCKVIEIVALTDVVKRVRLTPETPMDYKAGQYLQVVMGEKDRRPFSIASQPGDDFIELHIGAEPGNSYAGEVLEIMQTQGEVTVDGGNGNAFLREQLQRPVILMAGGTGFSYTWSILQSLLHNASDQPVFLYWGTRKQSDMYALEALAALATSHPHFTFVPVVEHPESDWQGKTGWVHKAVLADFVSLEPYQVYVAGRFEMAGVARQDFCDKGLHREFLFGDAYEFI